jgi:hypothetical protein
MKKIIFGLAIVLLIAGCAGGETEPLNCPGDKNCEIALEQCIPSVWDGYFTEVRTQRPGITGKHKVTTNIIGVKDGICQMQITGSGFETNCEIPFEEKFCPDCITGELSAEQSEQYVEHEGKMTVYNIETRIDRNNFDFYCDKERRIDNCRPNGEYPREALYWAIGDSVIVTNCYDIPME